MKIKSTIIFLVMVIGFFFAHLGMSSTAETERWTNGPWQTQAMLSWGSDVLIVDFGPNGLWSYDGSWIQLSHLDPENMVAWGDANLVVDFGSRGLWKFDRLFWEKIVL